MRVQCRCTYLILGDIEGKLDTLRVECTKCSRKGRYISAKGVPICSWAMCRASSYSSPYYSSYYAPRGRTRSYSVRSYAPTYPPPGDSYYVPPFATVLSYDPRMP